MPASHDPRPTSTRWRRWAARSTPGRRRTSTCSPATDPVFTWVSGTGARPALALLPDGLRQDFEAEFKRRLRAAYPEHPYGVVLPFRRVFAVAQVPA